MKSSPAPGLRIPFRTAGTAGVFLAVGLAGAFLASIFLCQAGVPQVAQFGARALTTLLLLSPLITAVGAILCFLRQLFAHNPLPLILTAMIAHLATFFFSIYGQLPLLVYRGFLQGEGQSSALWGKVTNGVYRPPDNSWGVRIGDQEFLSVTDVYNSDQKRISARFQGRTRLWTVEAIPLASVGVPATTSPEDFAKGISDQEPSGDIVSVELATSPDGTPTCRLFAKAENPSSALLIDNFCRDGIFYRLCIAVKHGKSYEADRAVLEENLRALWAAMEWPSAKPQTSTPLP